MRRTGTHAIAARLPLLVLFCALVGVPVCRQASPPVNPQMLGAYSVEFRGALRGTGIAAVAAQGVTITIQLVDEDGNSGQLTLANMGLASRRFTGTGTVLGRQVMLSGRVDPPSAVLKRARIVGTYDTSTEQYGRVIGIKQ